MCEQGYYEPDLGSFVEGIKSDVDLATFKPFLDPRRPYDLDSSRDFSSNPNVRIWVEEFLNGSAVKRELVIINGTDYLAGNQSQSQGGYACSIRSVTQWEDYRSGFVFDHPNYFSRYMDEKIEGDGLVYSFWRGMNWPATHHKSAKLVKYDHEFAHEQNYTSTRSFVYTDVGHMKDGVWLVTGAAWEKGNCVVEFERHCDSDSLEPRAVLIQDTDEVRHLSFLLCTPLGYFIHSKVDSKQPCTSFSRIARESPMMISALLSGEDCLLHRPRFVLIGLCVVATTMAHV